MITLLHGDNIEASRAQLNVLRAANTSGDVRHIDGPSATPDAIIQAVESSSLFGEKPLVIIENLLSSAGRKVKSVSGTVESIKRASDAADIILWEKKEIGKELMGLLGPAAKIQAFPIAKTIFQFLDAIRPGQGPALVELFRKTTATDAPELVFSMMASRVRQLIMVMDRVTPPKMSPWQSGRLTNQVRYFTMDKLLSMHHELLESEYSVKSGNSPLPLATHIERILIRF